MNFRENIRTMIFYVKLLLILLFITPLSASTDNLSSEFKEYKKNYASGRAARHDSNVAVSYLVDLTNQLAKTLDSNVARDLEKTIKRILGNGEGVGGLMKKNPLNPSAHYANEQQTNMLFHSILTVEKLRKDNLVNFRDYTETNYSDRNDDEAKHALALWAIAQGSQIARQHPESVDIYAELSRYSSPSPIVDLLTAKRYLENLHISFRELRVPIAEIEDAKRLFEQSTLTESGVRQIMQLHNDWRVFFDENLNPLKLPVFDTIDGIDRPQIIRKLFNSYQHRKIDFSHLIVDIEIAPSIEGIEKNTILIKQHKNEKTVKIIASKLAKAVGRTIPTTAAEEKLIKDAIIAIEQAREDERRLTLEDYLPVPGATEAEKAHALRIWIIAFGAQRALYNGEKGDLTDVLQNLDLLRSNPAAIFVRENWHLLNPAQVLGAEFVNEVNLAVPNIVKVRYARQLLRIHAQTSKPLESLDQLTFLAHLNTGLFFDAKFEPVENSYLQDKPQLASMMLEAIIRNTSERSRRFVTYTDLEGGSPATKLYYKNLGNGECGFFGLNKDRKSSSDEIVWNLDKPDVKQWVVAATLNYLTPGYGGMSQPYYVARLKVQYQDRFPETYDNWVNFSEQVQTIRKERDSAIAHLRKTKETLTEIDQLDAISKEIEIISKPFIEEATKVDQQSRKAKEKMKVFLEEEGVLQWILMNLFAPHEWIQFSGAGPDEEMLDFGDIVAFLNNLKVYTIASDYQSRTGILGVIANKDKANAKEIFLFNPSNGTHYDRLVDWNNWREQIRAERHEREFGLL